jgi:hypothetical protein
MVVSDGGSSVRATWPQMPHTVVSPASGGLSLSPRLRETPEHWPSKAALATGIA